MEYEIEDKVVVAKLDHGTDFFGSLRTMMDDLGKESGTLLTAIGMLKDFDLGYYNYEKGSYQFEHFEEPMELVSVNGSITREDMHFHAELAGENHKVIGGHLQGGEVFNVCEVNILVFDDIELGRELDEQVGSELLSVR